MPQRVIHNRFVDMLASYRTKLEDAQSLDDMCRHQGAVKALTEVLAFLHEADTAALKEIYV